MYLLVHCDAKRVLFPLDLFAENAVRFLIFSKLTWRIVSCNVGRLFFYHMWILTSLYLLLCPLYCILKKLLMLFLCFSASLLVFQCAILKVLFSLGIFVIHYFVCFPPVHIFLKCCLVFIAFQREFNIVCLILTIIFLLYIDIRTLLVNLFLYPGYKSIHPCFF